MRFGIIGSKGDPWHNIHLALAEQAWQQHNLDWVYLLPAGQPVDKPEGVSDKEVRWRWTKLAARGNKRFRPSRLELDRKGPSYMADTLRALRRKHGDAAEMFLIIGEDRAPTIASWHEADVVVQMCTLLIGPRNPQGAKVDRQWLAQVLPAGARFDTIEYDLSSSFIRQVLRKGGSARYLAPDNILRDIARTAQFQAQADQQPAA
jgi:nicotinate-nucleotide adenylyltransferase